VRYGWLCEVREGGRSMMDGLGTLGQAQVGCNLGRGLSETRGRQLSAQGGGEGLEVGGRRAGGLLSGSPNGCEVG
jgi:hypothetical protein